MVALNIRKGRWKYDGEEYARNTLRLIHELNSRTDWKGDRLFFAEVRDLVFTSDSDLKAEISKHPEDVYIIAHGGIKKNGRFVSGRYNWKRDDNALEGISPDGRKSRRFIPLNMLGARLNYDNIFGCYISKRVRRVNGMCSPDSYLEMYKGLYRRIERYKTKKMRNQCPKYVLIYEGENSGSNQSTEYMFDHYPLQDESYYEDWLNLERKEISEGRRSE